MTDPDTHTEHEDPTAVPPPPEQTDPAPPPSRHHTRRWVVATVGLAIVAIGLAAWALTLRSDTQEKDEQLAAQQKQLDEQQGVAGDLRQAAGGLAEDAQRAMNELGDADAAAACARGYLAAFGNVFDAESVTVGVEQAKSDIDALQVSCADALGS